MKTLVVSTDGKLMVTRPLWEAAKEHFDFDHVEVTREHGLEAYFNEADFSGESPHPCLMDLLIENSFHT